MFPTPPEVKAEHAYQLTETEYAQLIIYIVKAEAIFDIIAEREQRIKDASER